MNHYDSYITEYLITNKEVALGKIGVIKLSGSYSDNESLAAAVDFRCDKRISTSQELIDFIAAKTGKSRSLIESDLDSHLTQAREFVNIGKPYEILNTGIIKANNQGDYEFVPFSATNKAQKTYNRPARTPRGSSNTGLQVFTLLIVLAIVGGLGWEAYQYYIKPKTVPAQNTTINNVADTTVSADTAMHPDLQNISTVTYNPKDTIEAHYIFETTDLLLRARSRTAKLKSFGNDAGYDSIMAGNRKQYSLFISKKTRIADTLAVKDSLQKFLQKNIEIRIVTKQ